MRIDANPYSIRTLGLEQGLSCNYVVNIAQDKNGFLWFATEEGLNCFDGEQFFNYYKNRHSVNSISSSELNCVLDDPRHPWLWIGTKNDGLNCLNYETDVFTCYKHDASNNHSIATNDITHIAPAADGNIWITTYWRGVEYLNTQRGIFTHYNKSNVKGMPDNQLWCVTDLGNGIVMAGHVKAGISIIDTHNRTARNYQHADGNPNSISSNEVNCIYKDRNGTIWIGTAEGLDIFDQVNQRFVHVAKDVLNGFRIYDIKQFSDGNIWVATEAKGIAVIGLNQRPFNVSLHYTCTFLHEGDTEYDLAGNSVRCLLEDKYNNVWAGLYGNGINFLTQCHPLFETLTYGNQFQKNRLTERSVMGLAFDHEGNLWVGTDGNGVNVFSPDKERTAIFPEEVGKNVIAAYCDSQGTLWFGSFDKGCYVKTMSGSFSKLPLDAYDTRCFYEDKQAKKMWIGTSQGIFVVDVKSKKVEKRYQVGNNLVRAITKDGKGRIWVGYYGNGIEVFTSGMKSVLHLTSSPSSNRTCLPSNNINHLLLDSHHRIWAGSNEGAICFFGGKADSFRVYGKEEGLNNAHVRAFGEDKQHNIWMSTNRGISCLATTGKVLNFTNKENVPLANFNDGSVAQRSGVLYFGSSQGICYFNPSQVLSNHQAPKVFITSLSIISSLEENDSTINLINKKHISLAYDENTFSLSFHVQNYALEKYVEYSYVLQGMQDDWITTGSGTITLRDIPTGRYKLKVRSRMYNQAWSEEMAVLDITIRSPFWLSWWAKLIYSLLIFGLIWIGLRLYRRHLRLEYLLHAEKINYEQEQKLNEERLRFFTNITHELRTPLTLILGPLDDISHSTSITKSIKHKLAVIQQSALRLNDLITQILEFRKTETENRQLHVYKGNIVDAVHEICLKYEELAQKPNVVFHFVAPEKSIETYFDPEVIRTIVDNLISNAIKYTDQGSIDISVECRRQDDEHLIDITVSDTGHGISADALPHIFDRYYQENGLHQASGTGIGLSLVKNLVKLHEGEIKVESSLEQGTSFIFTIKQNNVYPAALHGKKEIARQYVPENNLEEKPGKKPLLLIVEDNKDILEYIASSFANDFEIVTASDGRDGLALALDKTPDVILSDIMMPNMDGNEMCRILKKDVRTSHIPVILLTAKDSLEAKEEGYNSGADSYITKPFTHSLLLSRIQNLLAQRKRNLERIQGSKETDLTEKRKLLRESLNKVDQEFFDKMNKLIEKNISGDVDVNMLAENLAMSTSTLYRKMKALTGISTNEYIRKYKMQYAERLLLGGKYTISEISFMVGMNSVAYFRRCFKAEFGEIPSEYLKHLKE